MHPYIQHIHMQYTNCQLTYLDMNKDFYQLELAQINKYPSISLLGKGISCKEKFRNENFQTGFVVAVGGFLSYWNHKLIKFERRDSDFKTIL